MFESADGRTLKDGILHKLCSVEEVTIKVSQFVAVAASKQDTKFELDREQKGILGNCCDVSWALDTT